jgi:chemotaxis protein histidine kinase CheA
MGESEILDMLATEADRRVPTIIKGLRDLSASGEKDPARIEQLRVDAHGLKGAAMVVGQARLAELGERVEIALVQRIGPGTIQPSLATRMVAAISAFRDGANAAANEKPEPPSVDVALSELRAKPDADNPR